MYFRRYYPGRKGKFQITENLLESGRNGEIDGTFSNKDCQEHKWIHVYYIKPILIFQYVHIQKRHNDLPKTNNNNSKTTEIQLSAARKYRYVYKH